MAYREVKEAPAEQGYVGHTEMHIHRRYGKFEGHLVHSDGSEHHIASQDSIAHAHEELGKMMEPSHDPNPDVEMAEPGNRAQNASIRPYNEPGGHRSSSIPEKD
jgi:hypothetical protein